MVDPMKLIYFWSLALIGCLSIASGQQTEVPTLSFEKLKSGEFSRRSTRLGSLQVVTGRAEIDDAHGSQGSKCLHLFGGKETTVTMRVSTGDLHEVRFQAERWTAREPFVFLVEAQVNGKWRTIEDASTKV